jgi:hypothetical protein
MKNDDYEKQIIDLVVNTIFIFYLQKSNNYKSIQKFTDDMSSVLVASITILVWSSRVFAQSLELWAQLVEKLLQLIYVLSQSTHKWAQSAKGVQGKWNGINIDNVMQLQMWSNQKMKPMMFIHNDVAKFSMWIYKRHINL